MALVIDRGTSALVSEINNELGRAVRYQHRLTLRHDGQAYHAYADKLQDYIQLKLRLHHVRRSMYYPFDSYCEKENIERLLEQAKVLRQEIKAARANAGALVWGELEPTPSEPGEPGVVLRYNGGKELGCAWTDGCLDNARRFYRGMAYCRTHFEQERWRVKQSRRDLQREREERRRANDERELADWNERLRLLKLRQVPAPAQFSHAGTTDVAAVYETATGPSHPDFSQEEPSDIVRARTPQNKC